MRAPFDSYIQDLLAAGRKAARTRPYAGVAPKGTADAPHVLLFSPHPDDECITGAMPLRLLRQSGCRITTVPMTYGSRISRRRARAGELAAACKALGFELFEGSVDVATILTLYRPAAIFLPHAADFHETHLAVHHLVMRGLRKAGKSVRTRVIETEYWHPIVSPNLMVESSARDVADLVNALALHIGEVSRNPYHLRLPAWMQDNVRRGAEVISGQGARAPKADFATLYRVSAWDGSNLKPAWPGSIFLPASRNVSTLLGEPS